MLPIQAPPTRRQPTSPPMPGEGTKEGKGPEQGKPASCAGEGAKRLKGSDKREQGALPDWLS